MGGSATRPRRPTHAKAGARTVLTGNFAMSGRPFRTEGLVKHPSRIVVLAKLFALVSTLAFALVLATFATGCQRELPLRLVEVHDVTPKELEALDRLEIRGAGFPQGRVAHLTFRGTLHRPGRAPERARIDALGNVLGQNRIDLEIGEALLASFTGTGARADHTTFRGELEVVFASQSTSSPPIAATLQGVVLDVFPSGVRVEEDAPRDLEGVRVLGFLGLRTHTTGTGLLVEAVAPGSRAEEAGITAGDVLTAFDGVRLGRMGDIRPAGGREAQVSFRRGESREETRDLSLLGLASGLPKDFSIVVSLIGLAVVLILAFVAPFEGKLGRAEVAIAARLRHIRDRGFTGLARAGAKGLFGEKPSRELSWLPPAVLFVASAALFALPGAGTLVAEDLDLLLLFVAFVASSLAVALGQEEGILPRARALVAVVLLSIPLVLALVSAISLSGSLRGVDVVRGQGPLPWEWNAFRSPFALGLALVCVFAQAFLGTRPLGKKHAPSADTAYRVGLLFSSGVIAVLFFGGYRLPGTVDKLSLMARIVAGLLLVGKAWTIAGLSLLVRFSLPSSKADDALRKGARVLPIAIVAFVAGLIWTRWRVRFEVEGALGGVLVLGSAVFFARLLARVKYVAETPSPHVDPFL